MIPARAERVELRFQASSLAQGSSDGTFRPDALVTREEFAVLLARALMLEGEAALRRARRVSASAEADEPAPVNRMAREASR
ncbi:S-layer homology domain-containing protein [Cohnella fermenti]|uniref:S-layer homology domain-containing protein n=1 Tax=Cohnella fermenti TaxID=2565925 RepID=A0A4S4C8U8_9BACL|nr:S-layer homology domain-containing protein [Cohnella fermenti]THF82201.1 S-layer homology domain-containing protein [Cohnella fermenti]